MKALLSKIKAPISRARQRQRVLALAGSPPQSARFSHLPRKPPERLAADLLAWWDRHRETKWFFEYGLEREGRGEMDDYVPYGVFKRRRDASNRTLEGDKDYNYVCLLEDKFVFSQFGASLGHRVPRNLAYLTPTALEWLNPRRALQPLEALWEEGVELDAFCKPLAGGQGEGVFPLRVSAGRVEAGDREVAPAELASTLRGRSLVQERMEQHPAMASLHPPSMNTIRLVTVAGPEGITPLCAAVRMGTGGSRIDNYKTGGVIVKLDLSTGRLTGAALSKEGRAAATAHPDSGVAFEGFEVPHFRQVLEAANRFHQDLPGFHSVGWDIGVTPEGPVLIEGNEKWDGMLPLLFDPPAMGRYLAMLGGEPEPHRHRWARRV